MASSIIYHPAEIQCSRHDKKYNFSKDTYTHEDLICILQEKDVFIMPTEDLTAIVNGTLHHGPTAALRAYLAGVLDCRLMMSAVM
jgi:hypothetical protein